MATSPPTDRPKLRMVTAIALVTLAVTSSVAYGGEGGDAAPDAVPQTPVREQLAWVVSEVNGDSATLAQPEVKAHFAAGFLAAVPAAQVVSLIKQATTDDAPIRIVRFAGHTSATSAIALIETDKSRSSRSMSRSIAALSIGSRAWRLASAPYRSGGGCRPRPSYGSVRYRRAQAVPQLFGFGDADGDPRSGRERRLAFVGGCATAARDGEPCLQLRPSKPSGRQLRSGPEAADCRPHRHRPAQVASRSPRPRALRARRTLERRALRTTLRHDVSAAGEGTRADRHRQLPGPAQARAPAAA